MSAVEKIEAEIVRLAPKEVSELTKWLTAYEAELWDKQIEADAKSGRLDKLWKQAEDEIASGNVRPLDELLDNS
jgi:hypothetical protein